MNRKLSEPKSSGADCGIRQELLAFHQLNFNKPCALFGSHQEIDWYQATTLSGDLVVKSTTYYMR